MDDDPRGKPYNLLSFRPVDDPPGLTIVDHVERRQCTLYTPEEVNPSEAPRDEFYFPVDRGMAVSTTRFTFPNKVAVYVRNHAGIMVSELTEGDSTDFPSDLYSVELCAPIKIYLTFKNSFSAEVSSEGVTIDIHTGNEVLVGARSHHESPAGTITTTSNPEDMMTAISHFGSALKTMTPERSYPTLRGHPPNINLSDELYIPPVIEEPDNGIRLILPPKYQYIYVSSTLVYYLGATVQPGDSPRLETNRGVLYEFNKKRDQFENEIEQVLKQIFFLDCIVRTEGFYPVDLFERSEFEGDTNLDFSELYHQNAAKRLESYLKIPYSKVTPHLPNWKLTAHTTLKTEHIELLPFVIYDLAIIKTASKNGESDSTSQLQPNKSFTDNRIQQNDNNRSDFDSAPSPSLIELEETDSLEQTWIGDGAPLGASKAMIEAFRNRLNREPTNGDIDITVVCNDIQMEDERDIVNEIYGSRDELPFNVSVHRQLSTEELCDTLEEETDFLHYIGHIDAAGFECVDGRFDASQLSKTGADAFFLNACTSYQQGMHLIEAGSIAGVVTLQDVINSGAERIGRSLAQLLNCGFPLRAALNIAKTQSIMGGHYLVIGDGNLDIAQSTSGIPALYEINKTDEGFKLLYRTFPTRHKSMGSMILPHISGNDQYYLASGDAGTYKLGKPELDELFEKETLPILSNQSLFWSDDADLFSAYGTGL